MKIRYFLLLILFPFFCKTNVISQTLKAVNDTVHLTPGIEKTVNLLANDTIPPGDEIIITGGTGASYFVRCTWHNNGYYTYLVDTWGYNGIVEGGYQLIDLTTGKSSSAKIVFIIGDHSYDYLDINNVRALINAYGNHFWTLTLFGYEVPKGSGKSTIFNSTFWIGGKGEDSILYLAAERYRQGPAGGISGSYPDFYAGPVMDSSRYSIYQDTIWNYVWKLKKTDIEFHKDHWNDAGYQPINDILTWPGNGNVNYGQSAQLAPFHDRNNDGIYNAMDGDYPSIRGDEALYFIFNDDRGDHLETTGRKMKIEVQGMAYAFNLPSDSAFNNTIFLNYKIFNRSQRTYYNTYLGIFTDLDIGNGLDDFIGCDVYRSSYFGYNGTKIDGNGQPNSYGEHPPAQSVTFLAGPSLGPTGTDRPKSDNTGHQICNESINGTGFGDGIPDNERLGMTSFIYFNNGTTSYMSDPSYAPEYYNYMNSIWRDATHFIYGGNGHTGTGAYGPDCKFMFPGESDTLNWGVGCQPPNGQVNWTETTAQNNPGDIRGVGVTGPFTFHPGDVQELDVAYVFARDYTSPDTLASVAKLRQMIDIVRNSFKTNTLPGGGSFLGVPENRITSSSSVNVYPNPAHDKVSIEFGSSLSESLILRIFNSSGTEIKAIELKPGTRSYSTDLSSLPRGLYLIHLSGNNIQVTKKICLIK